MNPILRAYDRDELPLPSLEDLLRPVKTAGFDGLELPIPISQGDLSSAPLAPAVESLALSSVLSDLGLVIPALSTFWPSPFAANMAADRGQVYHAMDRLATLTRSRIAVLRTAGPASASIEESLKTLSGSLIEAQNHFDPAGITLALEYSDRAVLGPYSALKDWIYFHSPETGLALDTALLAADSEDPFRSVTELGSLIKIVYLTEPLSSDRFSYARLFTGLKSIAFTGPLAIRPGAYASGSAADAVARVRELWTAAHGEAVAITEA